MCNVMCLCFSCCPDALMSVRHSLVTSKMTGASSPIQRPSLNEHCSTLYASIKGGLEASLTKIKEFIASTVSFSMRNEFRREFCMTNVRSGIVMTFINFVLDTCEVQHIHVQPEYVIYLMVLQHFKHGWQYFVQSWLFTL